ncbi:DUF4190 domain-containing protein [Nocardioides sambongensis]|uniref:DUF4190 domain-containing protein n=1 Tax=Nocardioides sambongensis TaxID=2589074 RepID=UPI0015E85CAF|nr:DUF4190 domain-containing protein [Nocardioides sambongensis]
MSDPRPASEDPTRPADATGPVPPGPAAAPAPPPHREQAPHPGASPYPAPFPTPGGYPGAHPIGFPAPTPPVHSSAVTALVLGIVSIVSVLATPLFGFTVVGALCAPFAVWLGQKARNEIRANPQAYSGEGLASAGFVTGIVGCVLGVLALLAIAAIVVFFVWIFAEAASSASAAGF